MNNKAQITIVLIIAVVIILITSISLYFYLSAEEKILLPEIKTVAEGALPISNYVTSCLKITIEDGLNLLGSQGGFLDVSNLKTDIMNPTNGEAVAMSFDSEAVIPYWYYLASTNDCEKQGDCVFVKQIPSEKQIKDSLKKYIKENLDDCIKDFQGIKNFKVEPQGEKNIDVYITDKNIQALLKYPIKITTGSKVFTTDEYLAEVNINLKKIISLATEIAQSEIENKFIEGHALNLLSVYSDIDAEKLPPLGKTEITFKGQLWVKSVLKEKIKQELLAPNMQFLRTAYADISTGESKVQKIVLDTELEEIDEETVDAFLNRGMILPLENDYSSLHTTFSYLPWWDVYFDLNCDGELCGPQEASINYLAIFGIQRYQFAYDLSYPVLIEITDPSAMDTKGYVFKFLLEANIRNNEELSADTEVLPVFEIEDTRTMLCDNPSSGEFILNVENGLRTGPKITEAPVTFICGSEKCGMGEVTDGVFKTKLPRCLNGKLEIIKYNFNPTTIGLNTFTDKKHTFDLKLEPYRELKVSARKYSLVKTGEHGAWSFVPTSKSLENKEEIIITINKKVELGEQGYSAVANVVGNPQTTTNPCDENQKTELDEIKLVPGDYQVDIAIISYDNITIPAERREAGSWPFEEKYTVPGMEFNCNNPLPIGQISFDWHIKANELDKNPIVEFYGVGVDFKSTPELWRKLEDVGATTETQKQSTLYQSFIKPVWKKR